MNPQRLPVNAVAIFASALDAVAIYASALDAGGRR
jgi:hypothetical protein